MFGQDSAGASVMQHSSPTEVKRVPRGAVLDRASSAAALHLAIADCGNSLVYCLASIC